MPEGAGRVPRRPASPAEAADVAGLLLLEPRDLPLAFLDADLAAPGADIGGVGRAMGAPAGGGMVVPGPEHRNVDFQHDGAAQAGAGRGL